MVQRRAKEMELDIKKLQEENKKLLFKVQDEALFGMKMVEDKSKLEDANETLHRALLEIGATNIRLQGEVDRLNKVIDEECGGQGE